MLSQRQKTTLTLLLVGFAIVFNEKTIAMLVSPDGVLVSVSLRIRILLFQMGGILTAWYVFRLPPQLLNRFVVFQRIIGLCLLATGVLLDHWVIARLFDIYGFSAISLTILLNVLALCGGYLLLTCQTMRCVQTLRHFPSQHWILSWMLIGIVMIEVTSYLYFRYMLHPGIRWSVQFVVSGSAALQPMFKPYLWSNYMANPLSLQANTFGWRYGGGPKSDYFRILCIGGSTTWTDGASSPAQSYPAQLERYLRKKGYHIDVVNAGVSYYTSAEELGMLAFRGIYTQPDLIVIHSGGNDIYPLLSPRDYRSDYTHWRTVDDGYDNLSRNDLFRLVWHIPSWTVRLLAVQYLKPDAIMRGMLAKEITSAQDTLLARNDVSDRRPVGLEQNLRSMIAIAHAHNIKVVTMLFNYQSDHLHKILLPFLQHAPEQYQAVRARADWAIRQCNETMRNVSESMGVQIIPFDIFAPSDEAFWIDECHLNDEGSREKAIFIGDWLIEHDLLISAERVEFTSSVDK